MVVTGNDNASRQHRRTAGYSLPELLIVLALAGLAMGGAFAAWQNYARNNRLSQALFASKMAVHQARLLSVYRNINHFVVIDPAAGTVAIHEDSGATVTAFENDDPQVSIARWPSNVELALPTGLALTDPLSGANLTSAWSLPNPDSTGAWGTNLRGVMTTPDGLILSAEATPATINVGTFVLTDNAESSTMGVGMQGLSGAIRAYSLDGTSWTEL